MDEFNTWRPAHTIGQYNLVILLGSIQDPPDYILILYQLCWPDVDKGCFGQSLEARHHNYNNKLVDEVNNSDLTSIYKNRKTNDKPSDD